MKERRFQRLLPAASRRATVYNGPHWNIYLQDQEIQVLMQRLLRNFSLRYELQTLKPAYSLMTRRHVWDIDMSNAKSLRS
jgi:hypothetical protein